MRNLRVFGIALVASLAVGTGLGCSSSDDNPDAPPGAGGSGGDDTDGGDGGSGGNGGDGGTGPSLGIDSAPEAKVIASVDFEEPVTTTVAAGPYVFALYADKDCGVLDLSDPEEPIDRGRIETPSRIIAVAYDEGNQLAYLASDKGDVLAIDMSIPGTHTQLASLKVSTLGGGISGLSRVGDRLFALAGNTLQPLGIARDGVTKKVTQITLQAPVTLDEPATVLDAGGGNLFVGNAKGKLQILSAPAGNGAPTVLGSVNLGGEIKGLVVRGSKVLGIAKGAGLKAVDFYKPEAPKVLFESEELADAAGIRVFGTTLVVGLDRGAVSTLDISRFDAVRAVTTNKGKLPAWISISKGQLFFGDDKKGNVANVPAFLSGRVTGPTRDSFPLKGLVPVTLSKEIDPATVSPDTVKLTCDGKAIAGSPTVMPLQHTFVFKPSEPLPAGAKCKLDLSGVRDRQGTLISAPEGGAAMDFTTAGEASKPVSNPGSKFPHATDGKFSDLLEPEVEGDTQAQVKNEGEWSDVTPAKGMYTYFYADFDGEYLYLMNDWFYGGENIEPDCYNQFHVWTGGGSEWWDVRAYGDQHVEVRKNGVLIDPEADGVEGGAFYGPSPNSSEPHTMYEIRVPAAQGSWGVQLHDPGPTFNCHVIEQEPHPMQGDLRGSEGSTNTTIDISEPVAPQDVTLVAPFDEMTVDPPVKLVWQTKEGLDFTIYQVQLATDDSFTVKSRVLDVGTYGSSLDVPSGLLKPGQTYYWHVIAWNTSGSTTSATRSFTVFGESEEPDGGTGGGEPDGGDEVGGVSIDWSEAYATGWAEAQGFAVNPNTGESVAVGRFWQPIDFGMGPLTPKFGDNETTFIVKFDSSGHATWNKKVGEAWAEGTEAHVSIDGSGNVIVAGTFVETVNLGGGELTSAGSNDIYVAKFTEGGAYAWSKRFGGTGDDRITAVVADGESIYLAGYFTGTIDFGGGELSSAGSTDLFVVRLGMDGSHIASRRFGDASQQNAYALAVDGSGKVVVAGDFAGTLDCGLDTSLTTAGQYDGFVMQLDEKLACRWQHRFGTAASESARVLATDASNNVYVGGNFGGTYLAKLSSTGVLDWDANLPAKTIGALTRLGSTGVIVTGSYQGDVDFGGGLLPTSSSTNVFFAAFDDAGDHVASRGFVAGTSSSGVGIGVAPGGTHVALGRYSGGIDLGDGAHTGDGLFVTKLDSTP